MGEFEDGVKDFMKALTIYKTHYGSHHNRASALAFGELGKIYSKLNQIEDARNCFKTAMNIINDLTSKNDPDYLAFEQL